MTQDHRGEFFESYFESSYKHGNIFSVEQLKKDGRLFDRELRGILPSDKNVKILDLGCGTGSFLRYLKEKGYPDHYGIDISPSQIEYCKANVSEKAEVADGVSFLKTHLGAYDLIVAQDVLEHIQKPEVLNYLKAIINALKPGGKVVIRVPNMSNPFGLDARFNDFTHEVGFTSKSLFQVLAVAGFKDIEILPPLGIEIRSFKNLIRSILIKILHAKLRFCFYIQDYAAPKNLDKNLIAVATKL